MSEHLAPDFRPGFSQIPAPVKLPDQVYSLSGHPLDRCECGQYRETPCGLGYQCKAYALVPKAEWERLLLLKATISAKGGS